MTEAIFNTLLAVSQMCSGHFLVATGNNPLRVTEWAPGFEQCAAIQKAVDDEQARRATVQKSEETRHDMDRLKNALSALKGKPFATEQAPPPPKYPSLYGGCVIPTSSRMTHLSPSDWPRL